MHWLTFWTGFFAFPALMFGLAHATRAAFRLSVRLEKRNWSVQYRAKRLLEDVLAKNDLLRSEIWFERSYGPVFTGHWVRQNARTSGDLVTRWVALGRRTGPCIMILHMKELD